MGRKKSSIPGRRQRVSRHSKTAGRHRLRVRQLLARRTRLRSYLQYFLNDDKTGSGEDAQRVDIETVE
ncbi:hypothetical protein [Microbulbifer sp. A4B17]|uniref:hypothetical protein n=1 Tax=Microbulbifer sp. A4B17 TaxID=359370 RepID=UPI001300A974|nr:hypothetical protein [Microbulbifer sp. A4B17]